MSNHHLSLDEPFMRVTLLAQDYPGGSVVTWKPPSTGETDESYQTWVIYQGSSGQVIHKFKKCGSKEQAKRDHQLAVEQAGWIIHPAIQQKVLFLRMAIHLGLLRVTPGRSQTLFVSPEAMELWALMQTGRVPLWLDEKTVFSPVYEAPPLPTTVENSL